MSVAEFHHRLRLLLVASHVLDSQDGADFPRQLRRDRQNADARCRKSPQTPANPSVGCLSDTRLPDLYEIFQGEVGGGGGFLI